jgi:two-component system, chemotaxis family, chemotaxis protein CheY
MRDTALKVLTDLRILVVDDNAEMCVVVRRMLADMGVNKVFTSKSGQDALKFLGSGGADADIDIILCDWNMPGMSGIELLRQLRPSNPDLPFLMITGNATEQFVLEAQEHGVTGYIAKPFSPIVLQKKLNAVAQMIAKRRNNLRLD